MTNFTIDEKTSNKSFLEMSKFLKMAGVKNNLFMLRLSNPALQGVDPFTVKDEATQKLVRSECMHNIWYFLREVARLPITGSKEICKYELNPVGMAIAFCVERKINLYINSSRMQGRSTTCLLTNIWNKDRPMDFQYPVAKYKDSRMMISRQSDLRKLLPEYLQDYYKYDATSSHSVAKTKYFYDIECRDTAEYEKKLTDCIVKSKHDFLENYEDDKDDLIIIESSYAPVLLSPSLLTLATKYTWDPLKLYGCSSPWFIHIELDVDRCGLTEEEKDKFKKALDPAMHFRNKCENPAIEEIDWYACEFELKRRYPF